MSYKIDAHCHYLNTEYLFTEVYAMVEDILHGRYPIFGEPVKTDAALVSPTVTGIPDIIKNLIEWFGEFIAAAAAPVDKQHTELTGEFSKYFKTYFAGETDTYLTFPLMMDIYFLFYGYLSPTDADKSLTHPDTLQMKSDLANFFPAQMLQAVKKHQARFNLADEIILDLENRMQTIASEWTSKKAQAIPSNLPVKMTPGYEKELDAIVKLVSPGSPYRGIAYPFIAVDSRRSGIDLLVKQYFVKNDALDPNRPFYGVKFYTRLGYKPTDAALTPVYELCSKYRIPITVHCGYDGFPANNTFGGWKWTEYADPKLWTDVFKRFPDLIVDFAHFGYLSEDYQKTILQFFQDYQYVYTDVACMLDVKFLQVIKTLYLDPKTKMAERLMFGTDFVIMLLAQMSSPVSLPTYYKQMTDVFTREMLQTMMEDIPKRFMGLK